MGYHSCGWLHEEGTLYVPSYMGRGNISLELGFFFGKRGAEQSVGLLGARMYPPGGERGTCVIPPHKEPEEEAGRDGGMGGSTHTRSHEGLRMRGAKGGGHTQPIVSG